MADRQKKEVYVWIRVAGLLSLIPFIMVAGPLGGYAIGQALEKWFRTPPPLTGFFVVMGFASSAWETFRIIRLAIKASDD